jgi:NADP+-dependent farnesol dehydrogenase
VIHFSLSKDVRKTLDCPKEQLNCIECDIRNEASVQAAFKWIDEKYGGIDLLINNAGVITKGLLLDAKNTTELYRTMETNIIGLCLVTREACRLMKKRDEEFGTIGHIVNINSIFGHKIHACVPGTKVSLLIKNLFQLILLHKLYFNDSH